MSLKSPLMACASANPEIFADVPTLNLEAPWWPLQHHPV
jgi:hypothetical protein